ncbi:hypothetical protein AB434_1546 [Heyndrickxia coagulans]|uniref:Uncharacterized protein n=1 Tax=Heyndrickxia coagulans TaxID=1398 RepID=A0AAN0WDS6_HEYCO|nr:hypothetical protein SB48_HM08orf06045 [Heyndrickxia coagulans]KGT37497.1 hypothetical protein P421_14935 [Heyndrickxia coagulans P38]AKN53951.1 hypothetical protein AB434_1546 [Heyndrickxia coagulans]ATW84379.1 hypothetical protein CIW84_16120 [Heyndrickxia coagulans]AVD54957.1 hypothetical protein C3766_01715 [Heyndrickxia coagulans]
MLFSLPDKKAALTNYLQRKMPQTIFLQGATACDSPSLAASGLLIQPLQRKISSHDPLGFEARTKRAARYKQKQGASFT